MELRRLRYFVAVAEELHFRRAAERLHLAQPALSQQIQKLETELGVRLLHRSKRSVSLTTAGAVFLEEARRLLQYADDAARAASDARDGATGKLRIGYLADALPSALPRAIAGFASRYPAVQVLLERTATSAAIHAVRSGRLDLAVVGLPAPTAELDVTKIGVEPAVAAVADRHLLSGRDSIPLAALADIPIVLLPRVANPAFHDGVIAACRASDLSPTFVDTPEASVEHALLLVASGTGVALLPASAADRSRLQGVSFRPLTGTALSTEIGLVSRLSHDETAIAAFLRIARGLTTHTRPTPLSVIESSTVAA